MDFATVAIGLGVCVIAAGVLFLISMFSFKVSKYLQYYLVLGCILNYILIV
jgi:hypothetical protein